MKTEARLEELGIELPAPQAPAANYVPAVRTGNLLYLAGVGPAKRADGSVLMGKVGAELTLEEGYEAARLVCLNIISRLKAEIGDLDRVVRVVKLLGMVNATEDFGEHPAVINGCSDLLVEADTCWLADRGRRQLPAGGSEYDCGIGHCLSLRLGLGNADRDDGWRRPRRPSRHLVPQQ